MKLSNNFNFIFKELIYFLNYIVIFAEILRDIFENKLNWFQNRR